MKFVGLVNSIWNPWGVIKMCWKVKYIPLLFMNSNMNSKMCPKRKKKKKKKNTIAKRNERRSKQVLPQVWWKGTEKSNIYSYYLWTVIIYIWLFNSLLSSHPSVTFTIYKTHKLYFSTTFWLKIDITKVLTHLKIILLSYFQFSTKIICI